MCNQQTICTVHINLHSAHTSTPNWYNRHRGQFTWSNVIQCAVWRPAAQRIEWWCAVAQNLISFSTGALTALFGTDCRSVSGSSLYFPALQSNQTTTEYVSHILPGLHNHHSNISISSSSLKTTALHLQCANVWLLFMSASAPGCGGWYMQAGKFVNHDIRWHCSGELHANKS